MGGGVSVPAPSPEERQLQQAQADLLSLQTQMLEQQRQQNRVLLPFLAEQEGYDVTLDANGQISGITRRADPLRAQSEEIQGLLNQQTLAALRGELPVSPALEQQLAGQEEVLRDRLLAQFGPGYETSSPGIETLGDFFANADALREGARTGAMTLGEQLSLTRQQADQFSQASSQDALRTWAVGDPLQFAGAYGQVARGYAQAQVPYLQQRQLQTQASMASNQANMALIGAGIGAAGAMLSDEAFKGDLIQISETSHGIPIYQYTRTDTGETMIGVLARDVEEIMPGLVYRRGNYDVVQYRDLH